LTHNFQTTLGITHLAHSCRTEWFHHGTQLAQKVQIFWLVFAMYTPIPAEAEFDVLTTGFGTIQICV